MGDEESMKRRGEVVGIGGGRERVNEMERGRDRWNEGRRDGSREGEMDRWKERRERGMIKMRSDHE